jgi:hypothetical protein
MAASNTNVDTLHLVIPTTGPQFLADATGAAISLVVSDANPDPAQRLDPNDVFVEQVQTGPAQLALPDGSAPNLDAAVLTPYSLVTPPGVMVVG